MKGFVDCVSMHNAKSIVWKNSSGQVIKHLWDELEQGLRARQQTSPDAQVDLPATEEGTVATADNPAAASTVQSASTFADQQIKYLLKTDANTGQVTYRVIHLAEGQMEAQADGAAAVSVVTGLPPVTQSEPPIVTQAVFSHAEGLETNLEAAESQYYYPATIPNTSPATIVTNVHTADSLLTQSAPTSQLYVMMSPQELLGNTHESTNEIPHTSRDNKRRAQHNEVERRRRDKINNWIVQLSKTIPDCNVDATKNAQSKGGILSKACNYIQELRQSNARLSGGVETLERLRMENQHLRKEVEEWKSKNQMLRNHLGQHGIAATSSMDP